MPVGLNAHPYAHTKLKQLNLCTTRRRRQMSLPNGSIANLSVTRKALDASNDEKLLTRDSGYPSRADSRRSGCGARMSKTKKPALKKRRRRLETIACAALAAPRRPITSGCWRRPW
jgi:hypothetical protein